jgi:hypothetical protein|tara:strand:- start:90 stop:335 length:246 start_codon:yes stop_codon:yes gene_type:complete
MVLSHSSFKSGAIDQREEKMKLAKDVYTNDAGDIKESAKGLPTGWAKGKLLGRKGQEISDAQAKEWGIGKKAKSPTENKSK